ncbi:MAG: DUF445 family protein [Spirochaetales bacterium]|nr:DUF445 family protein [Spirochaetales bacterium]
MNWDDVLSLLPWILPPVIGAAIGFITNDIAIRMLFRPLKEKRIFGIKIPFTPGIIPKQRYNLADSIGNMVANQLLTEDAVRSQLASPAVSESIEQQVYEFSQDLLSFPLAKAAKDKLPLIQTTISELLQGLLDSLFTSPAFTDGAAAVLNHFLSSIADKPLSEILASIDIEAGLKNKLENLIMNPEFHEKLISILQKWAHRHVDQNSTISAFVSDDMAVMAADLFRSILPFLRDAIIAWLKVPVVRQTIEVRGKLLLDEVMAKLNLIQRIFVSVGQYDKTISENMPEIIDNLVTHLEHIFDEEENKEQIVKAFSKAVSNIRKKGIKGILKSQKIDPDEKIQQFVAGLFKFLQTQDIGGKIAKGITSFLASHESETLGTLAHDIFGITPQGVSDTIMTSVFTDSFKKNASAAITGYIVAYCEQQGDRSIKDFFGVSDTMQREFAMRTAFTLKEVLADKIPHAMQSLNIKELVVNKINGLDVIAVENLLMMVIAKHLKWINVFGAILGALIGFIQIIVRLLQP